jgi:predicted dehydrogenase
MIDIRFGLIGLGLMGREFASAAARWIHLSKMNVRPVLVAACDADPGALIWFKERVPSIVFTTSNYEELLARSDVDAVYCAVPHHLHKKIYVDIIRAGKHLLGEKPFGIDLAANEAILEEIRSRPDLVIRCSSELPFYPGGIAIIKALQAEDFGQIVEFESGLLHSSDLDPQKPINWKRMIEFNGEYGCMGDLGMHAVHVPLRFGWMPARIRGQLSKIVHQRPDGKGNLVPCRTWDNATIFGEVPGAGGSFPITFHTKRIAPGHTNTWFLRVIGTRRSMEYSSQFPKTLRTMEYRAGGTQSWQHLDLGYASAYPCITGGIFEFGFTDSILQMWAAYCDELANGRAGMAQPFFCATPEEAHQSHLIFTAALGEAGRRQTEDRRQE